MVYAIDFGTSNTVISRWNQATQRAETLSLPGISARLGQNPPLIPSLLYVEEAAQGRVVVGQQVRDRALDLATDPRFFRQADSKVPPEAQTHPLAIGCPLRAAKAKHGNQDGLRAHWPMRRRPHPRISCAVPAN